MIVDDDIYDSYVFGFVEAFFVFPRNVPTKSEASKAPTPPGQFPGTYLTITIVIVSVIDYLSFYSIFDDS